MSLRFPSLDSCLAGLGSMPRVLDVGGWFIPLAEATHVVDLLPYETRQARLNLGALPGERFNSETWTQVDFTNPKLRLNFPDGFFDFAYCGHTIEDLSDPVPLLRELPRVARAGVIRCPSRLSEQTKGVRDRMTDAPGHPHHHWIVDLAQERLRLSAKQDSLKSAECLLPLTHYERTCATDPAAKETVCIWEDELPFAIVRGVQAAEIAQSFACSQGLQRFEPARDALIRALRRLKYWRRRETSKSIAEWWRQVLVLSRPYSRIPLPD